MGDTQTMTVEYKDKVFKITPLTPDQVATLGLMRGSSPAFVLTILQTLGSYALSQEVWEEMALEMAAGTITMGWLMGLVVKVAEVSTADLSTDAEA